MFAIIETGGKQYRVEKGDILDIERVAGASSDEPEIDFDRVLLVADGDDVQIGAPTVGGAVVKGNFLGDVRGPKITVFKFKRRKQYRRKRGHRQDLHRVRIDDILT